MWDLGFAMAVLLAAPRYQPLSREILAVSFLHPSPAFWPLPSLPQAGAGCPRTDCAESSFPLCLAVLCLRSAQHGCPEHPSSLTMGELQAPQPCSSQGFCLRGWQPWGRRSRNPTGPAPSPSAQSSTVFVVALGGKPCAMFCICADPVTIPSLAAGGLGELACGLQKLLEGSGKKSGLGRERGPGEVGEWERPRQQWHLGEQGSPLDVSMSFLQGSAFFIYTKIQGRWFQL